MADKQIVDFPGSPSFGDATIFHIWDSGVNKKISAIDMVAGIASRITPDASTTQKGVVQLSNSTDSNSQTTAATPLAVSTVATSLTDLSDSLGTAAFTDSSDYATVEQGLLASTALQSDDVGSTAFLDTVSNNLDTNAGKVPVVGWMGYGVPILLGDSDDILSLPSPSSESNSRYEWDIDSPPDNLPFVDSGYAERFYTSSSQEKVVVYSAGNNAIWVNTKNNDVWAGWTQLGTGGSGGIPEAPIDGKQYARKDAAWAEVVSTGGGGADIGLIDLGEVAVNGSQSITLDLSQGSAFYASLQSSNTTGVLSLEFSNIPESGNVDGYIVIQRAGRKPINLPSGSRYAGGLTPTFIGTSGSTTVIQFYRFSNMTPGRFIFAVNQVEGAL